LWQYAHRGSPLFPDLGCKHWPKPVPPGANGLVADVDPAFVEQVFDVPEGQWKSDIHHHCKTDDLRRCFEIAEWVFHSQTLRNTPRWLKPFSSDIAGQLEHFRFGLNHGLVYWTAFF